MKFAPARTPGRFKARLPSRFVMCKRNFDVHENDKCSTQKCKLFRNQPDISNTESWTGHIEVFLNIGGRMLNTLIRTPILTQNQRLEILDFWWFRIGHPSTMEILESPQGGSTERGRSLKPVISRGTSLENCCRGTAMFAYFIFSKILKIELSPTRKLNFRCFENWLGRIFRAPKIRRIAVLPAWEAQFVDVCAFDSKSQTFWDF